MPGTERILIERLIKLSLGEEIDLNMSDVSEYLRACLLLVSSHSIESLPLAERISYETYEDDSTGRSMSIRGLAVPGSKMLLTEVIDCLAKIPDIHDALTKSAPELSYEDLLAALYAIRCILFSFEWRESMTNHTKKFSQEKEQRMIAASLRSLKNYRETGEP